MASVRQLYVALNLRAENFNNQLREAQKESREFNKAWAPTLGLIEDVAKGLIAVGVTIVGTLAAVTKVAADYGDKMRDASIRTSLTTETLSGLKYQAEQTGTSFEALTTGLKFLEKNMVAATDKAGGPAAEAFNKLHISVKDLKAAGGEVEPILRLVADRFSELGPTADRSALAVAIFGKKSGPELIEFLSGGSKAIDDYRKAAELFGLVVSRDTANAADAFNDALNNLKQASLGLSLTFGNELVPLGTEFINWLAASIVTIKNFVNETKLMVEELKEFGGYLFQFLTPALSNLVKLLNAASDSGNGFTDFLKETALTIGGAVIPGLREFVTQTAKNKKAIEDVSGAEKERLRVQHEFIESLASQAEADKKAAEAVKKHREELDKIKASVVGDHHATLNLVSAIKEMEAAHVPAAAIAAKLAARLKDEFDTAYAVGGVIDPLIVKYYAMTMATERASDASKQLAKDEDEVRRMGVEAAAALDRLKITLDAIDRSNALKSQLASILAIKPALDDVALAMKIQQEAIESSQKADAARAEELKKRQEEAAKRTQEVWVQATANITSDFAKGLADVIFSGQNFGKAMVDIAKNTAKSMFSAFLTGLLSPLTTMLGNLGTSLSKKLSGILGGGGAGGGLLSSILGGGGTAAAGATAGTGAAVGTITPAGSFGLGPGGTAGAGGLLGLGSATIPAIGAAAGVIATLVSQIGVGRRTANEFVQNYQNPFGELLNSINDLQTFDAAVSSFWNGAAAFVQGDLPANPTTLQKWGSGYDTRAKVVSQAHDTLDPILAQRRADLQTSGVTIVNNFDITAQPDQDIGQLMNEIIRYIQSNSGVGQQFNDALPDSGV